jgi:[CysO sulfur-carrier protein]-S-L-cysteine hydrolase
MPAIPRRIIDEMVDHALNAPRTADDLREEICGLIGATDGVPDTVYRIANVADEEQGRGSPYRYKMHPMQMFRAMTAIEEAGGTLFGIYHSHIASQAYPSPTDVRMAFFPPGELDQEPSYPETFYILVSLEDETNPDVRAYYIRQGGVVEEEPVDVV